MVSATRLRLATFPTPAAGLALGIASLGWCWESSMMPAGGMVQTGAAYLAMLIALTLLAKFLLNPKVLWNELAHPVVGSVIPTLAMTWMVISKTLGMLDETLGILIWYSAIAMHLGFLLIFVVNRARRFHISHMLPSWFVPPVGLVVGALTCPGESCMFTANLLLQFGIITYLIMVPLMLFRLIFSEAVMDTAKPTIAILAAPPNLCLAGYLALTPEPSMLFVLFMLGIALLMTAVVYIAFFVLLRLPFSPAYAAFTFPVVIGATAMFKTTGFLAERNIDTGLTQQVEMIAQGELWIATAVVSYVALRYVMHYLPKSAKPQTAA